MHDALFSEQPGVCIVYSKGVYKQCPTAHRLGVLYAKIAGGFVRLRSNGETSHTAYRWDYVEDIDKYHIDKMGRLIFRG